MTREFAALDPPSRTSTSWRDGFAEYGHVDPLTPDVDKARERIQQAHADGRTAVLYTCNPFPCPQQAQIVKTDLARIGLQVQITSLPSANLFAREATPGAPFDLAWSGWIADYLDPQSMLSSILEDRSAARTGCQTFGIFGMDLAALCLRHHRR